MQRLLVAAFVMVACAGCLEPSASESADGDYVMYRWLCGFVIEGTICPYTVIDADGDIWSFHGSSGPGTGQITFEGAHPGIDADDVRALMRVAGTFQADRDYHFGESFGGAATEEEMDTLRNAAFAFRSTQEVHNEHPNLADGSTLLLRVDNGDWFHESRAYIGDGDEAFDGLRAVVEAIDRRSAQDAGIA